MKTKVLNIVGARPNFIKIAPLMHELSKHPEFESRLVHTGQHYDKTMSKLFFEDLDIPKPDIYLGVGSGNHGEQTGKVMIKFERILLDECPDLVIVVGDVNSTLACGITAVKHGIKLAHVEAGLRSFDRRMPEEVNRTLTDQIADFLFTTEASANFNLIREGISKDRIYFVGNVMIDTLMKFRLQAENSSILNRIQVIPNNYAVLTLHRPSSVDEQENFEAILNALEIIQKEVPIVFPVHPRTQKQLKDLDLDSFLRSLSGVIVVEPLGYLDFIALVSKSLFVLTDSGGIQEETTILDIPCLTLRNNTERPVTVEQGTNTLVGHNTKRIVEESLKILSDDSESMCKNENSKHQLPRPEYWDGHAAQRIARVLLREFSLSYGSVA